ncbi:MAG: M10 family metallopeptidase domain-containing protein [Acidimicrobiia bacterium]|nr:M10 family metallopeptidase domain-containing protein [Acidimicrobiia bacterium]
MSTSHDAGWPAEPEPIAVATEIGDEHTAAATAAAADHFDPREPFEPSRPIRPIPPYWRFRMLRQGCWLTRFTPSRPNVIVPHQDGTIRIERNGFTATASGDLYNHINRPRWIPNPPFGRRRLVWISDPEPNPADGIPIFARNRYNSYLRITQLLEGITIGSSFTLGWEQHRLDTSTAGWSLVDRFTAVMAWTTPPSGFPDPGSYLSGPVKNSAGTTVGTLTMGWVSPYYRKITVELDSVTGSEIALDNGAGVNWRSVMNDIGWQVTVDASDRDVPSPSGASWSDAEMHAALLARRDASNLDTEWRYHLLHVRQLDSTSRGIMYDAGGTDSNNVPREGAGISTHWVFPDEEPWGTVRGDRFGASAAPFFRTAVHELGHAFGLHHLTTSGRFMNTTNLIAGLAGTFPANIVWEYDAADLRRLRHWPDPRVRPGGIRFGLPYGGTPVSPTDEDAVDLGEHLAATATRLLDSVPLGAPVRIDLSLTNVSDETFPTPSTLGFTNDVVSGFVVDPAGARKRFSTVVHCVDEVAFVDLAPAEEIHGSVTLLRGPDGALFSTPGLHTVVIDLGWEVDGVPVHSQASTTVMIEPAKDDHHAAAAREVLSEPDLLLTLAIGGDHLAEGLEALGTAMNDNVLAPHYAVVAAKQMGQAFQNRKADVEGASKLITDDTVMSASEAVSLAEMVAPAQKKTKEKAAVRSMADVLRSKADAASLNDEDMATLKDL